MNGLSCNSLPIYDCRLSIENYHSERGEESRSGFLPLAPPLCRSGNSPQAYCPLPTAYCPLPTAYCLLPSSSVTGFRIS